MSTQNAFQASDLDPAILAILSATYGKNNADPNAIVSRIVTRNAPKADKPSKLAQVKAARLAQLEAAASESKTIAGRGVDARPAEPVVALPKAGTVDARGFFLLMRRAKDRAESINAIASFIGYDMAKDFGSQELVARFTAQKQLKAVAPLAQPVHTAESVIGTGFVPGLPNETEKQRLNLQAKERLTAESVAEHEGMAANETLDPSERHYHAQLALVERARLAKIRDDIAHLASK